MADVGDTRIALEETVATLAELEARAATDGADPAFTFNYTAVQKRRLRLEQQLRDAEPEGGEALRRSSPSPDDSR